MLIAESHISFHTFPERRFVTIDVYTCQNELDTDKLKQQFIDAFKLKNTETYSIDSNLSGLCQLEIFYQKRIDFGIVFPSVGIRSVCFNNTLDREE